MIHYDPFYPTNRDPLEISYRDWLKMIQKNPQLIDMCPGSACCADGWQKQFALANYMPMSTGYNCADECQAYNINAYSLK